MKKLFTGLATLLSFTLATPALALSQYGASVVDSKVAGVYRSQDMSGLFYLKRGGDRLYMVQGDWAGSFVIDEVQQENAGYQQTVHMLDKNQNLVTLKLALSQGVLTLADGKAMYMTRVRDLTRHDNARVDPILPGGGTAQAGAAIQASFDCAKAGTRVEKMICSDAALAELDTTLAARYASVLQMGDDKTYWKQDQRKWMKERNQCQQPSCLAHSYNVRIQDLEQVLQYLNKPAEYR